MSDKQREEARTELTYVVRRELRRIGHRNAVQWLLALVAIGLIAYFGFGGQSQLRDQNRRLTRENHAMAHVLDRLRYQDKRLTAVVIAERRDQKALTAFELSICRIQQRGLPAGHALSAVVRDLSTYLTYQLSVATPEQKAQVPPKQLKLLEDLAIKGSNYVKIERSQPATRGC